MAVQADVGNVDDWPRILDAARRLGGIDIAYLNAGVTTGEEDITKVTDEQYRRIMSVNVDGIVFGTRAVVPELVARGGGAVVATSSLAGIVAFAGDPMYTLTKHAVVGFVRSVAPRLVEQHITINAICPGLVDTPLIDGQIRDSLAGVGFPLIAPEAVAEAVLGLRPGHRDGPGRRRAARTRGGRLSLRSPPRPSCAGGGGQDPSRVAGRRRPRAAPKPPAERRQSPTGVLVGVVGQGRPAPTSPLVQIPVIWMLVPVSIAWTICPGPTYIVTWPMVPPSR